MVTTPTLLVHGRAVDLSRPLLMGIVNATPDSFSDAGLYPTTDSRVGLADELVASGADVIDVGGQSGITGVPEVDAAEEVDRVVPVIEGIRPATPTCSSRSTPTSPRSPRRPSPRGRRSSTT